MNRGCISLGNVNCDNCKRLILYPERYLIVEDKDGSKQYLCTNCCQEKGMVQHIDAGKGRTDISFDLSSH